MPALLMHAQSVTSAIIAVMVNKPPSTTKMGDSLKDLDYHIPWSNIVRWRWNPDLSSCRETQRLVMTAGQYLGFTQRLEHLSA